MKIATFGCSWTHGLGNIDNHYNWPKFISEENLEWQVDNYAVGGSSISFQLYCLNKALEYNNYDKIIFQFTTPGRLTYFPHDYNVFNHHVNYTNNYRMFDMDNGFYRVLNCITMGHVLLPQSDRFWTTKEKYNLMRAYYGTIPKEIYRTEYKAIVEYIASRVDLCFFHNEDILKFNTFPIVREEVKNFGGEKLLQRFIVDEGEHYNQEGCKWVGNWVLDRL
jgi:hypothetical protein